MLMLRVDGPSRAIDGPGVTVSLRSTVTRACSGRIGWGGLLGQSCRDGLLSPQEQMSPSAFRHQM